MTLVIYRRRAFEQGVIGAAKLWRAFAIDPFEGSRWRLRQTRAIGYGI